MMLRYLMIVAALLACVYVAVHARLIHRPTFLESVMDDVEQELKEGTEKAPKAPASEDAPPVSNPAPAPVAEPTRSATPEKVVEPINAATAPAPKAAQGHHTPHDKKTKKTH
jgi:hypothetical protein